MSTFDQRLRVRHLVIGLCAAVVCVFVLVTVVGRVAGFVVFHLRDDGLGCVVVGRKAFQVAFQVGFDLTFRFCHKT